MYSLYCAENSKESSPIKYMLNCAGVNYQDNIINSGDKKISDNFPCLVVPTGRKISKASKICEYLATEHGYMGNNAEQNKECIKISTEADELIKLLGKKITKIESYKNEIMKFITKIEDLIMKNKGYLLFGEKITFADFFVYSLITDLSDESIKMNIMKIKPISDFVNIFKTNVINKTGITLNYSTTCVDV